MKEKAARRKRVGVRCARIALLAAGTSALVTTTAIAAAGGGTGSPAAGPDPAQAERYTPDDRRGAVAADGDFAALRAKAGDGSVRVIVGLRTLFRPEGAMRANEVRAQREEAVRRREDVLAAVRGTRHRVVHTYDTVPYVALELSAEALDALQRSRQAASVHEDAADRALLSSSTRTVEATESAAVGRTGAGRHIAVLDTGVDKDHRFLQTDSGLSKVVSEACFSVYADCPGDITWSTSPGSGEPCTYAASGCRHGTHVAGIAAGRGTAFSGVAKDARLISINVFSRFTGAQCADAGEDPCARTFRSDQIKGLERVFALRWTFPIAAVNMSLGGGAYSTDCDFDPRKAVIDNLRSARIATVIATGNDGSTTHVSAPSCISSAIAVSSSDAGDDDVPGFANNNGLTELLAPGEGIGSSVPGGEFADFDGTSMAAPHVAGAWAVMKAIAPLATVGGVLSALQDTGKRIRDSRSGVVRPRIRLLSAGTRFRDTSFKLGAHLRYTGAEVASNGRGLATRAGGPSASTISISGIPTGSTVRNVYLYWTTIGGPDSTAVLQGTGRIGTLVGASRDSCWYVNQNGPNRMYRALIPTSVVPGNGTYTISGIGGSGGVDGQGASLVVVYTDPASAQTGRVVIRHGGKTAVSEGRISDSFTGLVVPSAPSRVRLHTGMADGQAGTEDPLLFEGSPVTTANFFSGKDGVLWDDDRIGLSTALLPAGTTSRAYSVRAGTDCLALTYAALVYRYP